MKTKIIQNIKSFILVLILVLGVSYAYATFTAPTQAPPGCPTGSPGCDTPLNVGNTGQVKFGGLTLGHTYGTPYGLIVENGNVGIGTVSPATKLDVVGTVKTTNLQVTAGAAAGNTGKVLKFSDDLGNVTWSDTAVVTPAEAQAIPAYEIETVEGTYAYNVAFICRMKVSDGSVYCFKANKSPINKLLKTWVGIKTEIFSATTPGSYGLSCSPGRSGYNRPFCCRIDKMEGDTQCKYAKDTTLTNWVETVETDFGNGE